MFGILGEIVNKFIRIEPDCLGCYNSAIDYSDRGDNEAAIEAFKEAIRIDPKFSESYCQLSHVYFDIGRKQESIEILREGIKATSDKEDLTWLYHNLGFTYMCYGQWKEAIEAFKKSDSMDSVLSRDIQDATNFYIQEAIEALKQNIKINPDTHLTCL